MDTDMDLSPRSGAPRAPGASGKDEGASASAGASPSVRASASASPSARASPSGAPTAAASASTAARRASAAAAAVPDDAAAARALPGPAPAPPPILSLDSSASGGTGTISGLGLGLYAAQPSSSSSAAAAGARLSPHASPRSGAGGSRAAENGASSTAAEAPRRPPNPPSTLAAAFAPAPAAHAAGPAPTPGLSPSGGAAAGSQLALAGLGLGLGVSAGAHPTAAAGPSSSGAGEGGMSMSMSMSMSRSGSGSGAPGESSGAYDLAAAAGIALPAAATDQEQGAHPAPDAHTASFGAAGNGLGSGTGGPAGAAPPWMYAAAAAAAVGLDDMATDKGDGDGGELAAAYGHGLGLGLGLAPSATAQDHNQQHPLQLPQQQFAQQHGQDIRIQPPPHAFAALAPPLHNPFALPATPALGVPSGSAGGGLGLSSGGAAGGSGGVAGMSAPALGPVATRSVLRSSISSASSSTRSAVVLAERAAGLVDQAGSELDAFVASVSSARRELELNAPRRGSAGRAHSAAGALLHGAPDEGGADAADAGPAVASGAVAAADERAPRDYGLLEDIVDSVEAAARELMAKLSISAHQIRKLKDDQLEPQAKTVAQVADFVSAATEAADAVDAAVEAEHGAGAGVDAGADSSALLLDDGEPAGEHDHALDDGSDDDDIVGRRRSIKRELDAISRASSFSTARSARPPSMLLPGTASTSASTSTSSLALASPMPYAPFNPTPAPHGLHVLGSAGHPLEMSLAASNASMGCLPSALQPYHHQHNPFGAPHFDFAPHVQAQPQAQPPQTVQQVQQPIHQQQQQAPSYMHPHTAFLIHQHQHQQAAVSAATRSHSLGMLPSFTHPFAPGQYVAGVGAGAGAGANSAFHSSHAGQPMSSANSSASGGSAGTAVPPGAGAGAGAGAFGGAHSAAHSPAAGAPSVLAGGLAAAIRRSSAGGFEGLPQQRGGSGSIGSGGASAPPRPWLPAASTTAAIAAANPMLAAQSGPASAPAGLGPIPMPGAMPPPPAPPSDPQTALAMPAQAAAAAAAIRAAAMRSALSQGAYPGAGAGAGNGPAVSTGAPHLMQPSRSASAVFPSTVPPAGAAAPAASSAEGAQTVRLARKPSTASISSVAAAAATENMATAPDSADLVTEIPQSDKRYRNRKLLRDLRQYLYRWLNTTEFRQITETYSKAEWVPRPGATSSKDRFFHVNFQARDYYKTNHELMDELIRVGLELAEAHPQEYGCAPGVLQACHIEDVAKDLLDSARSGFRQSLRTNPSAKDPEKDQEQASREAERAKVKQRHREVGAMKMRHPIPRPLLLPGAFSDDAASDDDLHGMDPQTWRAQRRAKLKQDSGFEAMTPKWRNPHLSRAYQKADRKSGDKSARWRRDEPVDLDVPHSLRGRRLPSALFDRDWLRQNREALAAAPYYITIDEEPVPGWNDQLYPLDDDAYDAGSDDDEHFRSNKRKRTSAQIAAFPSILSSTHPSPYGLAYQQPGITYSMHSYQMDGPGPAY